MIAAPQAEGSGIVVTGWQSRLALVDGASSVAETSGGGAMHTRAWSVGVLSSASWLTVGG
jgi:hypothetical protein